MKTATRLATAVTLTTVIVAVAAPAAWLALRGPRPLTPQDFAGRPLVQLSVEGAATGATDGSLATAWVVSSGEPRGEQATIPLPGPALVEEVEVGTGLQASPETFSEYGRVRILLLTFADGQSSSVKVDDRQGWQRLDITDHVTEWVTATVVDLYPGADAARPSAALAELRLWGREREPR